MRILITTDTVGGVWTFTKELATELLRRGCQVTLVSFGASPSSSQVAWCESNAHSNTGLFYYQFSTVALEWMQNNDEAYVLGAQVLLNIVMTFDPDIFLSSQFCFGALPINIPRVVIAHSDVLSWSKACYKDPLKPSEWLKTYHSLVVKGVLEATAVVAPTEWMLRTLASNFHLPPDTSVIPNGRALANIPGETVRRTQAVIAGRLWDEAKNIAILEKIASPIPIILAGEADSRSFDFRGRLQGVTIIGRQSEDDLLAIFRESVIYICTSIYEPFGLAPLEAALCGCAVIANDIPSLREVWRENALYFRDAASLSALLNQLNDQEETLNQAQRRSFRRAQEFSSERMADSYLFLFDRLLNREGRHADAA